MNQNEKVKLIGIAGASYVGKSTLCSNLVKAHPSLNTICMNDYFKDVKSYHGFPNYIDWDNPNNISWTELIIDIQRLSQGKIIYVPIFKKGIDGGRIGYRLVDPNKTSIILIEGYLLFTNIKLRNLFDESVFLELVPEEQYRRRQLREATSIEYLENFIRPTYEKYILPTRMFADQVLDLTNLSQEEVVELFERRVLNPEP